MIMNVLTCKNLHKILELSVRGCDMCNILWSSRKGHNSLTIRVIHVSWSGVSRWRRIAYTLGSLSIWKMLDIHPNMSLGHMCAMVCWDEVFDSVNLFLIMPLSWDFTLHGLIHAHDISFQTSNTKPRLQDTEADTVFSDTAVLLL